MLFVDVIAASGTQAAGKVLLERIISKEITEARAATAFMTYSNNVVEPTGADFLHSIVVSTVFAF